MAKITTVTAARKPQGKCGRCGADINKGDPYRHVTPGFRGLKLIRCMAANCYFRGSELTTSKMSGVYAAVEDAQDSLLTLDTASTAPADIRDILDTCAEAVREVAEEYREASQAWAGGNGNEEFDEKADAIEDFADSLDSTDVEEYGDDADPANDDSYLEGVINEASEALGDFSM